MKKFKINIIYLLLGIIVTSCSEDFINLSNPNQLTTGTFWKTQNDAIQATNAIYSTLYYDGLYMRLYPWVMDVRADDCRNTSPWWITDVSLYNVTPDNPCYIATWEHAYKGIWRANQVLENVPKIEMNETLKKRCLAEAKFLRAFFYYHLVIFYNNVPLILKPAGGPDEFYPSQAKPEETWAQIIKDFTEALTDLPTKEEYKAEKFGRETLGRATKGAAAGYLAKSYMVIHEFDKAAPILKDIIDGKYGHYDLIADYRDNFTEANENNVESLFEVQFDRNVGGTVLGWTGDPGPDWSKTSGKAKTYAPLGFGWGDITPTDWIFNEFQKELTKDGELDPRMKASMFFDYPGSKVYGKTWAEAKLPNKCHIRKYLNDDLYPDENEWRSGINERVLRFADILLLYAEALNELNRTSEAYPFIQRVRDRANLPDLAVVKPNMTQDEMRKQIAHERALEFCFEAQRYVDILRWGWYYNNLDELISHDPEFAKWVPGREYMAIPPIEININKNLKQNPGW